MSELGCPCAALSLAHRRSLRFYEDALSPLGLTLAQAHLLLTLHAEDALQLGEAAKRLAVDPATLTPLVDKLEKRGLVVRCPHPNDRRAWRLCLQDAAHAIRGDLEAAVAQAEQQVAACLSAEEYEILKRLLWKLAHAAQEATAGKA